MALQLPKKCPGACNWENNTFVPNIDLSCRCGLFTNRVVYEVSGPKSDNVLEPISLVSCAGW
jgi:hypothetical protein